MESVDHLGSYLEKTELNGLISRKVTKENCIFDFGMNASTAFKKSCLSRRNEDSAVSFPSVT